MDGPHFYCVCDCLFVCLMHVTAHTQKSHTKNVKWKKERKKNQRKKSIAINEPKSQRGKWKKIYVRDNKKPATECNKRRKKEKKTITRLICNCMPSQNTQHARKKTRTSLEWISQKIKSWMKKKTQTKLSWLLVHINLANDYRGNKNSKIGVELIWIWSQNDEIDNVSMRKCVKYR